MKTGKNSFKQLWIVSSLFIIYLLLGSFIVSRSIYDIIYLIMFCFLNIKAKLIYKEDSSSDE